MALFIDTHSFGNGLFSAVARVRSAITTARARRAAYRRTYNELKGLSDHELNDLGLSRADIGQIARASAH